MENHTPSSSEARTKDEDRKSASIVIEVSRPLVKELTDDWSAPMQVRLSDKADGMGVELVFRALEEHTGVINGHVRKAWIVPSEGVAPNIETIDEDDGA